MHGVTKESSSTTKLRVVFDAGAHSSTNISLNDILSVGPTLHPTLDQILHKFRTYRIAISGDISKMYREVLLNNSDRQLHRFLWRQTQPASGRLSPHDGRVHVHHQLGHGKSHSNFQGQGQPCPSCGRPHRNSLQDSSSNIQSISHHQQPQNQDFRLAETNH